MRRVDQVPVLGERESSTPGAHEVVDAVHDRTRLAMEPPALRVEGLDDERALSNEGEVSGGDVFRPGVLARDNATLLRVERAEAQLTRRAGTRRLVHEVEKAPAIR